VHTDRELQPALLRAVFVCHMHVGTERSLINRRWAFVEQLVGRVGSRWLGLVDSPGSTHLWAVRECRRAVGPRRGPYISTNYFSIMGHRASSNQLWCARLTCDLWRFLMRLLPR